MKLTYTKRFLRFIIIVKGMMQYEKICFVLTVSTGLTYTSIFPAPAVLNNEDLKSIFQRITMFRLITLEIRIPLII